MCVGWVMGGLDTIHKRIWICKQLQKLGKVPVMHLRIYSPAGKHTTDSEVV